MEKAGEIMDACDKHGIKAAVGVEPDMPEDLAEVERLLAGPPLVPEATPKGPPKIGRNEPCPCGSGRKYKKCCYGKD
jgi:uncharacterized protein YecA (UPF0149 family)